jgi:hypothetical protein
MTTHTETTMRWVYASERLPLEGQECVLVCRGPEEIPGGSWPKEKALGYRFGNGWVILDDKHQGWDVLAWLPIPPEP